MLLHGCCLLFVCFWVVAVLFLCFFVVAVLFLYVLDGCCPLFVCFGWLLSSFWMVAVLFLYVLDGCCPLFGWLLSSCCECFLLGLQALLVQEPLRASSGTGGEDQNSPRLVYGCM